MEKESAGNDKKIMLYKKKWQDIENMLLSKTNKRHVSLNIDSTG